MFVFLFYSLANTAEAHRSREIISLSHKTPPRLFGFYLSLAALHDDQFLLRGSSGEDDLSVVLQDVVQCLYGQIFQVSAVDYASLGIPGGYTKPLGHSFRKI